MIDINFLRQFPEKVKDSCKKRNMPDRASLVDEVLALDKKWKDEKQKVDQLRQRRNTISLEINETKKKGKDISKLIKETRELPEKVRAAESHEQHLWEGIKSRLMLIPNVLHDSVPVGKSEADNVVVRTFGKKTKHAFTPKSHVDLIKDLDLADLERAAKVSGARFYYLKNQLVILNLAVQRFALDLLVKKGFTVVHPPYMMNRSAYEGAVSLDQFEETLYKIEGEDLFLIATAEHPLDEMHSGEVLPASQLPLVYAGISPCFRKEAGAHGKDTKGIFRVHQFDKIEQFVICTPEDSYKWMEKFIKNAEEFFKALEIPCRVVNVCSVEASKRDAKQYDIEAWMPAQNTYKEVVTCDNCTSWVSARSNIRFEKEGKREFVHTVDCTLVANPRAIVAILENFQNKDGGITIPKVLRKYTGFDKIVKEKR